MARLKAGRGRTRTRTDDTSSRELREIKLALAEPVEKDLEPLEESSERHSGIAWLPARGEPAPDSGSERPSDVTTETAIEGVTVAAPNPDRPSAPEPPATPEPPPAERTSLRTRLVSILALAGVLVAIGWVGNTVYHVATDGFVAPIILSPDSDMVIQSKLSMSQLLAEKMRTVAKKEVLEVELAGTEQAIAELAALHVGVTHSLAWTRTTSAQQARAGQDDLTTLSKQKVVLTEMLADEEKLVERMGRELAAGLVAKADYTRELQALKQMHVAALENERAQIVTGTQLGQAQLAQSSLQTPNGSGRIATPEMIMQQDQLVRVKCEMIRLEAEKRSKTGELVRLADELTKIEELLGQLKKRPIFRAIEANTNVAFVPYSQIDGVTTGARIYDCVWGVVACKPVGRVAEMLPGEAIVQDPWGSPARGQYAILDLDDPNAARSKTLRVRPAALFARKTTEPLRVAAP